MKRPISRQALEQCYEQSLKPLFDGLTKIFGEFTEFFGVVELPKIGLDVLDALDSNWYFGLWEFKVRKSINFELEVAVHFNHYDYEVVLAIADCYTKNMIKTYDKQWGDAVAEIPNEIGIAIIDSIKKEFPET